MTAYFVNENGDVDYVKRKPNYLPGYIRNQGAKCDPITKYMLQRLTSPESGNGRLQGMVNCAVYRPSEGVVDRAWLRCVDVGSRRHWKTASSIGGFTILGSHI